MIYRKIERVLVPQWVETTTTIRPSQIYASRDLVENLLNLYKGSFRITEFRVPILGEQYVSIYGALFTCTKADETKDEPRFILTAVDDYWE